MIVVAKACCGNSYSEQHEAGVALRNRLITSAGYDLSKISFAVTDKGKPYAENAPIAFSVTHSESLVLCALSFDGNNFKDEAFAVLHGDYTDVGLDAQLVCDNDDTEKLRRLAKRYLGENISSPRDFYAKWTEKEALGKLTGKGVFAVSDATDAEFFCYTVNDGGEYSVCLAAKRA